ncbi:SMP-30/gluconolactonase/LRE family protein [Teichococcus coralli]|nr:SMP-30/gluconolactonase/LRE family protein [Pseudoroseomonas coralli]
MQILDTPRAAVGESPVWAETTGLLWWVDVRGPCLHRTDPRTSRTETWALPEPVGSLACCRSGALLLALRSRVARFDPRDGRLETVAAPEADRPHNRLNDGKASPCGRFVVGGMDDRPEKHPTAALWCVHPGGAVTRLVEGMTVSNGLAWSPDGATLWFSDSRRTGIWTAPWDQARGGMGEARLVAAPDDATGRPDGAAMDAEGGYWSAGVSAGVLNRWLPDGTLDRVVRLPLRAPTMPCFGGPGLRQLFVTSLRGPQAGPHDGGLLVLDVGVAGAPVGCFAD